MGHPPARQREHGERRAHPRDRARQGPASVSALRLRRRRARARLRRGPHPPEPERDLSARRRRHVGGGLPGRAPVVRLRPDAPRRPRRARLERRRAGGRRDGGRGPRPSSAGRSPPTQVRFRRFADMRYRKQGYEIRVPIPDGPLDAARRDEIRRSFEAAYRAIYGHTVRGRAHRGGLLAGASPRAPGPTLRLPTSAGASRDPRAALKGERRVYLPDARGLRRRRRSTIATRWAPAPRSRDPRSSRSASPPPSSAAAARSASTTRSNVIVEVPPVA